MRTANPVFSKMFGDNLEQTRSRSDVMTVEGTIQKTLIMLFILVGGAIFSWMQPASSAGLWMGAGAIGGLIASLVVIFAPQTAPVSAPIYAGLEGLFLGAFSAMVERYFPGLVFQAVGLTFGIMFCLLGAYRMRWIAATEKFKAGILAATLGIMLVYLTTMTLGFFGVHVPYIHEGGAIGIGFSVFVVIIAALNLVLDFDFIEQGAESGAPKRMEWIGAFGLMVTLVWLYIEIVRLLVKIASSRD